MAAILFAVHPIHTEAVTGVVGRAELLRDNTLLIITMRTQLFDLLPLDQIFFLLFSRTVGAAKRPAPTGSAKLLFSYLLLKKSCKYSESSDGRGLDPAHPDGLYFVPIEILPIPC